MGCGPSKIHFYRKKSKEKKSKETASDADKGAYTSEQASSSTVADGDINNTASTSSTVANVGRRLVRQIVLSRSQENFFKMLDEKIESGPDYDPNDETEIALEKARLQSLLKAWESASASSKSLPATPTHVQYTPPVRPTQSAPRARSRNPLTMIPEVYDIPQEPSYRQQTNYNPIYQPRSPSHRQPYYIPNVMPMNPSSIQYQETYRTNYSLQPNYALPRQYPLPNIIPVAGPSGSPTRSVNNSPKRNPQHISPNIAYNLIHNSPPHNVYMTPQQPDYSNGEQIIQHQLYNQQIQYQQSREYQQYRQHREQLLMQQQISGTIPIRGNRAQVPIVAVLPQNGQSPKMSMQRKQREYSNEMM